MLGIAATRQAFELSIVVKGSISNGHFSSVVCSLLPYSLFYLKSIVDACMFEERASLSFL
jgi:hypothetical protein